MFQGYCKGVSRVFKGVPRMFQGWLNSCLGAFQGYLKVVFKSVSRVFQGSFEGCY